MIKVVLCGAGDLLKRTLSFLRENVHVVAIADNDTSKQGKKYRGIPIVNPTRLSSIEYDYIVISNERYLEEIVRQLDSIGIMRQTVLPIYNYDYFDKTVDRKIKSILNLNGYLSICRKHVMEKQIFFPDLLGVITNPYYFSRRGLWKSIEENKKYISGRCLDFGCGTKPYERLFNVDEYIGVEIEGSGNRKDIVYYDGRHIPFPDESFDSIICSEVFEHIPNLDEIVDELKRVLKKGGYMVVTVPFAYPEHCIPYDFRRFSSFGIEELAKEHNLSIVHQEKVGSFMNSISQMNGVFINEKLTDHYGMKYVKKGLIVLNNVCGIINDKLLPKDYDLYLDNSVVYKK